MENNINAYPETNLFKTNKHDEQNITKAIKASGVNSLPKPTICDNKRIKQAKLSGAIETRGAENPI